MRQYTSAALSLILLMFALAHGDDQIVVDDTTSLRVEIVAETAESLVVKHKGDLKSFHLRNITGISYSQSTAKDRGRVYCTLGESYLLRKGDTTSLHPNLSLKRKDVLGTRSKAAVDVITKSNNQYRLMPLSVLKLGPEIAWKKKEKARIDQTELRQGRAFFSIRDTTGMLGLRVSTPSAVVEAHSADFSVSFNSNDSTTVVDFLQGNVGIRPVGGNVGEVNLKSARSAIISGASRSVFEDLLDSSAALQMTMLSDRFSHRNVRQLGIGKRVANAGMVFSFGTAAFSGLMVLNFADKADKAFEEYNEAGPNADFTDLRGDIEQNVAAKEICAGIAVATFVSGTVLLLTSRWTKVAVSPLEKKVNVAYRF